MMIIYDLKENIFLILDKSCLNQDNQDFRMYRIVIYRFSVNS